jgi:hypothetical protein
MNFRCPARHHARIVDDRFLRIRCTDRNCPYVREAKPLGLQVFHVWDLETRAEWTDYVKPEDRRKR